MRVKINPKTGAECRLEKWKHEMGYQQRSLSEAAIYRYKQLFSPRLTMRDHRAQVGEALANVKNDEQSHRTRYAYELPSE